MTKHANNELVLAAEAISFSCCAYMRDHFTNIFHLKEFQSSFMRQYQDHTIQCKIVLILKNKELNIYKRYTVLSRAAQMLRTFLKVLQCKNYDLFISDTTLLE